MQMTLFYLNDKIFKIPLGDDLWFERVAMSLLRDNDTEIKWSSDPDSDLYTDLNLQKGIYRNWRPVGYSLFLMIPLKLGNYILLRNLLQAILFSFIPVILFQIMRLLSENYFNSKIAFCIAFAYISYPYFLILSQQNLDTGFIILSTILSFYFMLKFFSSGETKYLIKFLTALLLLLLFKPMVAFSFLIFSTVIIIIYKKYRINLRNLILSVVIFVLVTFSINYYLRKNFEVDLLYQTNGGYNLFLGNNELVDSLLIHRYFDSASFEIIILSYFDKQDSIVGKLDEYGKDKYFFEKAMSFINENPIKFIKNIPLKVVGFFSPIRFRKDHFSDSELKSLIYSISYGLLLISFFMSLIMVFMKRELRFKFYFEFLLFIIIWTLPYLIFLPLSRYRQPIEFLMFAFVGIVIMKIVNLRKRNNSNSVI